MTATVTASESASKRLTVTSNQYYRIMRRNRPQWYRTNPLDTAPRCLAPWTRPIVRIIRDWGWKDFYKFVAKQAARAGNVYSKKCYGINGVIWDWQDPASSLLLDLFTSDATETVEFAISSDPFWAPHIVVTHSPGDASQYLDKHGNPDQLTDTHPTVIPNLWGCTPRQSFVGPTGKDQLLLPPRMSLRPERDDHAEFCAAVTINRRNVLLRLSIQFHEGLRKVRARRQLLRSVSDSLEKVEHGRQTDHKDLSVSHVSISDAKSGVPDFEPMTRDEVKAAGFSDSDAAESLFTRCGIMFQPQLDDINSLADSAILSDESEDEDEDEESLPSLPHSPTIASDTFEVLRRLGMVHCDTTYGEEDEEDETEDESGEDGDEDDNGDESEDEDEDDETTGDITIPESQISVSELMSDQDSLPSSSWEAESTMLPISAGSLDLVSMLHKDADEEQSSVSSLFIGDDQDSIASSCETPDTEDEC